jgi:hypothetical protein
LHSLATTTQTNESLFEVNAGPALHRDHDLRRRSAPTAELELVAHTACDLRHLRIRSPGSVAIGAMLARYDTSADHYLVSKSLANLLRMWMED